MARTVKRPGLLQRTPILEWIAAALGLLLTVSLLVYLVGEGLSARNGPPALSVATEAAKPSGGGFVVPVVVRNASNTTAAAVEVRGTLEQGGRVVEERRLSFTYVPGGGEVRGGLIFQRDPRGLRLSVSPEGYEEP
ncbi:hypothetical protein LJR219_002767 [Phenylobacterium sp. LjRoot219]|uniref:hypothetical protein n=1 Tax=Phenylobacterium sp. LjRoot219 TaxID=3342283 RepID=UPI003ECE2A9B